MRGPIHPYLFPLLIHSSGAHAREDAEPPPPPPLEVMSEAAEAAAESPAESAPEEALGESSEEQLSAAENPLIPLWGVAAPDKQSECSYSSLQGTRRQAFAWCQSNLIPLRPRALIQVPGAFLLGIVWGGGNRGKFVLGPAVGITPAVQMPIVGPRVIEAYRRTDANGNEVFGFRRPRKPQFVLYGIIALNTSITGLNVVADDVTELGFTAGYLSGLQWGLEWFDDVESKIETRQFLFSFSVVAAYAKSDSIGDSFLLGLQPSLVLNL